MPAPTKLFQPSGETLLSLSVSDYTPLSYCLLSPGNTFQECHALLHELIALNVHKVCAWQTMLGNEDWLLIPLDV